jgi:hypothetical protein
MVWETWHDVWTKQQISCHTRGYVMWDDVVISDNNRYGNAATGPLRSARYSEFWTHCVLWTRYIAYIHTHPFWYEQCCKLVFSVKAYRLPLSNSLSWQLWFATCQRNIRKQVLIKNQIITEYVKDKRTSSVMEFSVVQIKVSLYIALHLIIYIWTNITASLRLQHPLNSLCQTCTSSSFALTVSFLLPHCGVMDLPSLKQVSSCKSNEPEAEVVINLL